MQIILPNLCKVTLKTFGDLDQPRKRHHQLLVKEGGAGHRTSHKNPPKPKNKYNLHVSNMCPSGITSTPMEITSTGPSFFQIARAPV